MYVCVCFCAQETFVVIFVGVGLKSRRQEDASMLFLINHSRDLDQFCSGSCAGHLTL